LFLEINNITTSGPNRDVKHSNTLTLNSGAITVNNNTASGTFDVIADELTEGDETFNIIVRSGHYNGPEEIRSSVITIKDTSKKPTYSIQPNVSEINEGDEVTFNISTANVANGTQLTYSLSRTDVTPSTGTVTIEDNKGSFKVTASNDSKTEGYTKFNATLKRGATDVVTSNDVGVKDTSVGSINHKSSFTIVYWHESDSSGDANVDGTSEYNALELVGNTAGPDYEYYFHGRSYRPWGKDKYTEWWKYNWRTKRNTYTKTVPLKFNEYNKTNWCSGYSPENGKLFFLDNGPEWGLNTAFEINSITVKNTKTGKTQNIGIGFKVTATRDSRVGGTAPTLISDTSGSGRLVSISNKGCKHSNGYAEVIYIELNLTITI
jgi:hypothetical protein